MVAKKYPIGTSIKYLGDCKKCSGKIGKVVGASGDYCYITLPQSTCGGFHGRDRILVLWSHVEKVVVKGQQLLFSFMEK